MSAVSIRPHNEMELTDIGTFFQELRRKYENVSRAIIRSFTDAGDRLSIFMMDLSSEDTPIKPLTGTLTRITDPMAIEDFCEFLKCGAPDEFTARISEFEGSGKELGVFEKRDRVIIFHKLKGVINAFKGHVEELPSNPFKWLQVLDKFPKPAIATIVHRDGSSDVKLTINIKRTPKLIGTGTYGCVYYPPIPCKNSCTSKYCNTGVSKLIEESEAKKEMEENATVRKIDPSGKYHWAVQQICDLPDDYEIPEVSKCSPYQRLSHGEKAVSIIMPYGGKELHSIFSEDVKLSTFLFNSFENLFEALVVFKRNKFVHLDIKSRNAVFTGDPKGSVTDPIRLKFIDFGLSFSYKDVKNPFSNSSLLSIHRMPRRPYPYWPPEINLWNYVFEYVNGFENNEKFSRSISTYNRFGTTFQGPFYPETVYPLEATDKEYEKIFSYYYSSKRILRKIDNVITETHRSPRDYTSVKVIAEKIDVFSLGVVMGRVYRKVSKNQADEHINENVLFKEKFRDLIKGMLDPDFETRFTPEKALEVFKEVKAALASAHSKQVVGQMHGRRIARRLSVGSIHRK